MTIHIKQQADKKKKFKTSGSEGSPSQQKRAYGFGSIQPRFCSYSCHPKLIPPIGGDPCYYHPIHIRDLCEATHHIQQTKGPWRNKADLEAWSRNLGYRNEAVLKARKWQKSLGGPAWCTVQDLPQYEPACKNVSFGRPARFKSDLRAIPGPGTYYREKPYKAPYGPHSTRPTLEREEPCRFKDLSHKWSLAPNRYEIVGKDMDAIENVSKKVVSKRGPYDLFTGKRNYSNIKNYFGIGGLCTAATWPVALPGSLETIKKSHYGRMNKTGREFPVRTRCVLTDLAMALRKPSDPGPGHHDLHLMYEFTQNKQPFNSSNNNPRNYPKLKVWPGVGRYTPNPINIGIKGQGHKHIFLSKVQRTIGAIIPEPLNSF